MSSSSDEDNQKNKQNGAEHIIKPSKGPASIDTSTWPLLLKVSMAYILQIISYIYFLLFYFKHTNIFFLYRIMIN